MATDDSSDDEYWNHGKKRNSGKSDEIDATLSQQSSPTNNNASAGAPRVWNTFSSKKRRIVSVDNDPPDDHDHSDSSSLSTTFNSKDHESETGLSQTDNSLDDDEVIIDVGGNKKIPIDDKMLRIGQRVAKKFENDIVYFGKIVTTYNREIECLWHVEYDDGDSEDLTEDYIKEALRLYDVFRQRELEDVLWFSKVVVLRHQFIVEKENFLSELPINIKSHFLELGFARWARMYLPVMYLGPYDVSPGAVRDEWMENYKKHKNCIDKMPRLAYWYGAKVNICFSFVEPKDCFSLSDGIKRGFCKIPANETIGGKAEIKCKTPLSKKWEAYMQDMSLPPQERKGGPKLREDHELVEDRLKLLVEVYAEKRLKAADD